MSGGHPETSLRRPEARRPADPLREPGGGPWLRLSIRVIWVDLAVAVLSLTPLVAAIGVAGIDPGSGQLWPLFGIAVFGVLGAVADAARWIFTRYRVTDSHVELKTGVLVRTHRSVQRDRIRSVDVEARLRHRLAGLRVVNVGAGQQSAAETALPLDALPADDARALRSLLLGGISAAAPDADDPVHDDLSPGRDSAPEPKTEVLARFQPGWVIYNVFNVWAYALALGIGWGSYWLLTTFGADPVGYLTSLTFWTEIGWAGTIALLLVATGVFGVLGLAVNYFLEYWGFELIRVHSRDGRFLRTRKGLLTRREVDRDEDRIRGAQISEPLLWRWLGVSDTEVVTTGLDQSSSRYPATILPRGPITAARRIAAEAIGAEPNPFLLRLESHPAAALRRRLAWATAVTAGIGAVLVVLVTTGRVPATALWAPAALWPFALGAAFVAYRALGHTADGRYLVTRSGLISRSTVVLQRSAVSTVALRESPLQRRLGLRTVSTMMAAGYGAYHTADLAAHDALEFATTAAPGILDEFLTEKSEIRPAS